MYTAVDAKYVLCRRHKQVVNRGSAKMCESGAEPCSGKCRQCQTAGTAVEVDDELRPERAQSTKRRRQNFGNIRVAGEDLTKPVLYNDTDAQVWPRVFENVNC